MKRSFTIEVAGRTLSGKAAVPADGGSDLPVVVALHGGSYSSEYFDVPGYSLLDRAGARGVAVVAVDRPGYGRSTPLTGTTDSIAATATVLLETIPGLLAALELDGRPVVLLGHSIGGAMALAMAAHDEGRLFSGLAISGVGERTLDASREAFGSFPRESVVDLPPEAKDGAMFGPPAGLGADMPAASRVADAPAPAAELVDINVLWHDRFPELAARVRIPVHARQAEFDALWTKTGVDSFVGHFVASPHVDAAEVPGVGHCIDLHLAGAALQDQQLDFAERVGRP
jgi:pimeloyl-ACP methyl ester carboxylesterase